jgi:hypothetical protein
VAQTLTFTSATFIVNWEEDWVMGKFARSDASSMWLFARAKGAAAGSFRIHSLRTHCTSTLLWAAHTPQAIRFGTSRSA